MDQFNIALLTVGTLVVVVGFGAGHLQRRSPLSEPLVALLVGVILGPLGFEVTVNLSGEFDIKAHQNWADLAVDAFHLILQVRKECPVAFWKSSQLEAAQRSLDCVRTAVPQDLLGLDAA